MSQPLAAPFFIELAQGWAKGLKISFETSAGSQLINKNSTYFAKQVHGCEIFQVTATTPRGMAPVGEADGLFVQGSWFKQSSGPLLVQTADCIPLVLVSEEEEAVALLHAGWRGLQQGIHTKLFDNKKMTSKRVWAWVGPSLGPRNFQVREDMWAQFAAAIYNNETFFARTADKNIRLFNAWALVEHDLRERGVELVYNFEEDTFQNRNFFSYRRHCQSKETYGSNFSWVGFQSPREL